MSTYLLVTTCNFGHLLPGLAIAETLSQRGHRVVVHTAPKVRALVEAAGATLAPYDEAKHIRQKKSLRRQKPLPSWLPHFVRGGWWQTRGLLPEACTDLVDDLDGVVRREGAHAIVADSCAFGARYAAERAKVAFATFAVTPHLSLTPSGRPQFVRSIDPTIFDLVATPRLGERMARLAVDAVAPMGRVRKRLGLARRTDSLPELYSLMASDQLHIVPAYSGLFREPLRSGHLVVGPMSFDWDPPGEDTGWLDALPAGTVLITTTTDPGRPNVLLPRVLEALAPLKRAVVANAPRDFVPPSDVSSGTRILPYVPHGAVLDTGRVAALVSHGGWGIVGRALRTATPSLLIPQFGDQLALAERLHSLGLARHLRFEESTPSAIRSEVEALLADDGLKARLRAVAADLAGLEPRALVGEALEALVKRHR